MQLSLFPTLDYRSVKCCQVLMENTIFRAVVQSQEDGKPETDPLSPSELLQRPLRLSSARLSPTLEASLLRLFQVSTLDTCGAPVRTLRTNVLFSRTCPEELTTSSPGRDGEGSWGGMGGSFELNSMHLAGTPTFFPSFLSSLQSLADPITCVGPLCITHTIWCAGRVLNSKALRC